MKKRNLILSLICSIALTVALVTFTVITVIPSKNGGNDVDTTPTSVIDNEGKDGSLENPYVIADTDMLDKYLVGKYLDDEGNYIDYNQIDIEGNYVYPELQEGLNFELADDINYEGVDFGGIFNKGMAFNGTIDGKGHSIKNVTINVTKDNLAEFMYLGTKGFRAHIGFFGKLDGATIKNLKIENINIKISQEVLDYLKSAETTFVVDNKNVMYELCAGLVAGLAFDSTIEVEVSGSFEGFAYCYREDDKATGTNAIGGLVGSAVNTDLSNSIVEAQMTLLGTNYWVGGLVGKAYEVVANNAKTQLNVFANYKQQIYVGGIAGYAAKIEIDGMKVTLNVTESGDRIASDMLDLLSSDKVNEMINIAGMVAFIRANDENQTAVIKNTFVNADVAIDGVYAGAYIEVFTSADKTQKLITLSNNSIVSNVDTLKAFGLAKNMKNTIIESKLDLDETGYDFAITGTVRFNEHSFSVIALYIDDLTSTLGEEGYYTLTIILGKSLKSNLSNAEFITIKLLEKANRVEVIEGKVAVIEPSEDIVDENNGNTESGSNVEGDENVESGDNTESGVAA